MRKFLIFCSVLFPLVCYGDWWITTVDNCGMGSPSIELDSLGFPHIAYSCNWKGSVRYASWNPDSTWTTETIASNGCSPSFKFDSKWRPHIAYSISRYVYQDSSGWHTEKEGIWANSISMDLDSKDYPHILGSTSQYCPPRNIYHSFKDSTGWHLDTVEFGSNTDYGAALVVDNEDTVHISYPSSRGLIYAKKTESGWHKEMIDNAGTDISMVLNYLQQLCIAYRYNGILKYARKDSIEWKIIEVDTSCHGYHVCYPSLCIDFDNLPRISYRCDKSLKYAWFDGSYWNITTIEDSIYDIYGTGIGMTVDSIGYSYISYNHRPETSIKCAVGYGFVGVEERQKTRSKRQEIRLEIYPNPFIEQTVIRYSKIGNRTIHDLRFTIHDVMGRLVEEVDANATTESLHSEIIIGEKLLSGIYFVKAKGYKPVKVIKMGGIR